jgi:hypothetical protein
MRAVYSEKDFVFTSAVYAINGELSQKEILLNIAGLLNSKIYAYFNLMIGSSIGVERESRLMGEVLTYPFVDSEIIANQVAYIQEILKQDTVFAAEADVSDEIDALNASILEEFELSDNDFVDYALRIQIPLLTGKNDDDAKRGARKPDFEVYGKYFYNNLSEIFESAGKYVQIRIYPVAAKNYSAFEVMILNEKPDEWLLIVKGDDQKAALSKLSFLRINELFYTVKDVLYFEENSFYIIKSSYYRNWHPAIARLDFMEVTDQILSEKKKEGADERF